MDAAARKEKARIASRFIPLTRQAIIADLCAEAERRGEADAFAKLALRLQKHRHHAYRALAEEVRHAYLPSSPDRDTVRTLSYSADEKRAMEERLTTLATHLLDRANYNRLSTIEIDEILSAQSPYSLRIEVDLKEYDELLVYVRDLYVADHAVRRPETLFLLKSTHEVRVFRRLFVLLKLKEDDARAAELAEAMDISHKTALRLVRRRRKGLPPGTSTDYIYIKVFKDMPQHDLQILFPLRKVQFRPFDKIKFFATAGGGTLFGAFSTTGKLLAATNPIAALGAMAAFVGLLTRQVTSFFNQRNRYMMELAQKLFFHNLANNRAALTLLLDRAEEEDVKEDLLALFHLAGRHIEERELAARKREIDDRIAERYDAAVDFELDDALSRLAADGVVKREAGALTVASIAEAAQTYARLLDAEDEEDARHLRDPSRTVEAIEV